MQKIFELAKEHKITLKELSGQGLSSTYLSKIKRGHNFFKEKHIPLLVGSFNRVFHERKTDKIMTIDELSKLIFFTPQEELDKLVNKSLIDKSIYFKEKQEEIELFGREKEVYSLKYRYIIAKYNQKMGKKDDALKIYHDLLNNFPCSNLFYSILIEIIRLEKFELTHDIYLKYKKQIDIAPYKTKTLLAYNTGVNLLRTKKWSKAISCFEIVINIQEVTKHFYHSFTNLGICYKNLGKYEKAIEFFKKGVSDPTNYKQLKICYVNILSCAKEMKYEPLMINTLKKLETTLKHLKGENIYQTYWNIGKIYLHLKDRVKAVEAFEKEISFEINLHNTSFSIEKHLDSIKHLVILYGKRPLKQEKLIKHIQQIEFKYLSSEFIISILKYYFNNNMEYEASLLIKNINL
ncbi:tetratricopeptide repeat protein [Psychrilyobacter atlanticus]|uniref:tetratricopeptide repeat protein n=1 Tax=Psychrilyobacter atlanticus TaxID=271091 RepID=UPI000429085C|nr:tetratricopeptide repeat protein [Psychrilyobacter atlanticus]